MGACAFCRRNRLVLMGLATPVGDLISGAEYIFRLCATTAAGPSAHVLSPTIKMTLVPPMPPRKPQVHSALPSPFLPLPARPLPFSSLRAAAAVRQRPCTASYCGHAEHCDNAAETLGRMDSLLFTLQLEVGEGGDHLRLLLRMDDWAEAAITDVHVECAAAARRCAFAHCSAATAEWFATAAHAKGREVRAEQSSAAVRTASDGVGRVQSDELRFDAAAKAFHFDCDDTGECGQPSC